MYAIFFIAYLVGIAKLSAQDQDSLALLNHDWNTKTVKDGLVWKQANFTNLFSSRQEINILEVDLKKLNNKVKLAGLPDSLVLTSDFAKTADAVVAVNGGFFNMKQGGATDYIKIDNRVINTTAKENHRGNALFAFDGQDFLIADALDSLLIYETYPNVMRSGPLLLSKGQKTDLRNNAFNDNRHPRTAVGLKGSTLLLITVDGRNANAQGMNLKELANILKWLGSNDAMNLDGGGSTTMYIKGTAPNGVVNYPSDNKQFDHQGERKVANVILVL